VDIDYEPLPPVIDMAEAAADGAPLLFPAAGTNVAASFGDRAALAADLFDDCEVVVSRTIANQRWHPRRWRPGPRPRSGGRTAG